MDCNAGLSFSTETLNMLTSFMPEDCVEPSVEGWKLLENSSSLELI